MTLESRPGPASTTTVYDGFEVGPQSPVSKPNPLRIGFDWCRLRIGPGQMLEMRRLSEAHYLKHRVALRGWFDDCFAHYGKQVMGQDLSPAELEAVAMAYCRHIDALLPLQLEALSLDMRAFETLGLDSIDGLVAAWWLTNGQWFMWMETNLRATLHELCASAGANTNSDPATPVRH